MANSPEAYAMVKSFLVLFFKKEHFFLPQHGIKTGKSAPGITSAAHRLHGAGYRVMVTEGVCQP